MADAVAALSQKCGTLAHSQALLRELAAALPGPAGGGYDRRAEAFDVMFEAIAAEMSNFGRWIDLCMASADAHVGASESAQMRLAGPPAVPPEIAEQSGQDGAECEPSEPRSAAPSIGAEELAGIPASNGELSGTGSYYYSDELTEDGAAQPPSAEEQPADLCVAPNPHCMEVADSPTALTAPAAAQSDAGGTQPGTESPTAPGPSRTENCAPRPASSSLGADTAAEAIALGARPPIQPSTAPGPTIVSTKAKVPGPPPGRVAARG